MKELLGRHVAFVPHCSFKQPNGRPLEELPPPVHGVVDFVHQKHGWFRVRWAAGESIQHECFKFCDIGKAVTLVGRKKNVHAKNHRQ